LALMQTSNFKSDEHWMTQRLNINIVKVRQVLKRLESLELVKKVNDQWVLTNERLDTSSDMQSAANLHYHKSCLKEVEEAMEEVHLEMRELTSITFAADVEKLKSAKMLIRDFRWQICELLNKGNPQEVYRLNIQLIPVTKIKGEKS
ncbi:MAG: TIGR02147 family protein, partial [Bdellovibrionales bacterium]|nr:TIGR02147 family protein [Bdellovibrionales bacterium]